MTVEILNCRSSLGHRNSKGVIRHATLYHNLGVALIRIVIGL